MRYASLEMKVTVDSVKSDGSSRGTDPCKNIGAPDAAARATGGGVSTPAESIDKFEGMSLKVKTKQQEGDVVEVIDVTPAKPGFARPVQWDVLKCLSLRSGAQLDAPPMVTEVPIESKMQ